MLTLPGVEMYIVSSVTTLLNDPLLNVGQRVTQFGITPKFLLFAFLVVFVLCIMVIIKRDKALKLILQDGEASHNLLIEKEKECYVKKESGSKSGNCLEQEITKKKKMERTVPKTEKVAKPEATMSLLPYHLILARQLRDKFQCFSEMELQHCVLLYMGVCIEETAKKLQVPISDVQVQRCKVRSKILKSEGLNLKLYMNAQVLN